MRENSELQEFNNNNNNNNNNNTNLYDCKTVSNHEICHTCMTDSGFA